MRNFITTIVLCFISINTSYADILDGQREGLTIGLGLGAAATVANDPNQTIRKSDFIYSGSISYAFNDRFQIGLGKKGFIYKYNNKTVGLEIGGIVLDIFMDDYYLTIGGGQGGAGHDLNRYTTTSKTSFVGVGYRFSEGLNLELVAGNAKFKTNTSVVVPEKISFVGLLLTTYLY